MRCSGGSVTATTGPSGMATPPAEYAKNGLAGYFAVTPPATMHRFSPGGSMPSRSGDGRPTKLAPRSAPPTATTAATRWRSRPPLPCSGIDMMDDHALDHEDEYRAANYDRRHPQGRFGVADAGVEVPLE